MTKQTFYRKLRKYASQFKWKLRGNSKCIRAYKEGEKGYFCPITAVYFAEHGIKLPSSNYYQAADKMDINFMEASLIAFGADNDNSNDPTYKNSMRERKALLRSVGLE